MPKLLIVTTVAATLRAFLLPYARHFRDLGWRVDALSRDAESCAECRETFDACHEVPFSRKPWALRGVRRMNGAIRNLVLREGYDIVHVHTPVASFVTRTALGRLPAERRPKIVYTAHGFHFHSGGSPLKNRLYLELERRAARRTDHLIVINEEDRRAALEHALVPPERLTCLPGIGLDLARWSRKSVSMAGVCGLYEELGLGREDELFLMVAEFNPGKRHRDALNALAKTGRRDFHLALAGRGPLEDEMKALAERLGISRQVHFLGQRSDIPLLMLTSRATILPSEREGLNRSLMESIALGIPVLGADVRGIRDLVTDPSRGTLYPVGNSAALAAAMLVAAAAPSEFHPLPDSRWDLGNLLKEHERIYSELLG
ncbi:glycosyltransferase [uncultured Fretibacterium sp.]|uniref:glycosyltransferase n=1 Tax=uncultured Fretibacterium sp. TaxID=1678694 RepID=UPI00325FB412